MLDSLPGAALTWVGATGNAYGLYKLNRSWADAEAYARSLGGYLVKATSPGENAELFAKLTEALTFAERAATVAPDGGGIPYVWLGASDVASEGAWTWVKDGSELSINAPEWGGGALGSEPDNFDDQDYLALGLANWPAGSATGAGFGNAGDWNDIAGGNTLYFVVEKEPAVSAADTLAPTVQFTDNLPGAANRTTTGLIYTLTFNEPVTGLAADDFTATNATVGAVTGGGAVWRLALTPATGVAGGSIEVVLKAGAVTDAAGNANDAASSTSQAIDTVAPLPPKLVTGTGFYSLINPQVTMTTSLGTVVFELYPERAPAAVANLLAYAYYAFYDNTVFHRVVPGFVVQGGGYSPSYVFKTPAYGTIPLESANGLTNQRGSLAMARGSAADSASTQFYVNLVDNPGLDFAGASSLGYAVFGQTIAGLNVIDAIGRVTTIPYTSPSGASFTNLPQTPVILTSLRQTLPGSSKASVAGFELIGIEAGAQWAYSLNAGATWTPGSGTGFTVPEGSYAHSAIRVRQTDAAGNTSQGNGVFTTALVVETTPPALSGVSPADEGTGIWAGSNVLIAFSEAIQRGVGSIVIKTADGVTVAAYDASDSPNLVISQNRLSINPAADFAYATGYRIEIEAGAIKDLAGNAFAGTTAYNFTTVSAPDQVVIGDVGDELLTGTAGRDLLSGAAGNDTLSAGIGDDVLDGGTGLDAARFASPRSANAIRFQAGADIIVTGPEGTDTLHDIERTLFADGALAFDIDGTGGRAYRLYQAAFKRTPDELGLGFWIAAFDEGFDLVVAAGNFLVSAEFINLYGANPTNNQFTQLLYRNVLQRDPDQAGYDFWNAALTGTGDFSRVFTRAEVLAEFSESAENQANVIGVMSDGFEYLPWVA